VILNKQEITSNPEAALKAAVEETPSGDRLVLLVKGNPAFMRLLKVVLDEAEGYLCQVTAPDEVPDQLARRPADLVVIIEDHPLYRQLRELPEAKGVPMLLVTVSETDRDKIPPLAKGDRAWVMRNNPAELVSMLRELAPVERYKRVLSVDDSPTVLKQIKRTFAGTPYVLVTATNGQEALDVLDRVNPDLILTDIEMPVMDGLNFCRRVRGRPDTSEVPLIILSSRVDYETIAAGFESGADEYLTKPFFSDELLNKVESYLVPPPARRQEQVLVVSANRTVLHQINTALSQQGFEVSSTTDPQKALSLAEHNQIDLAVVDDKVGSMTGFELCAKLKAIDGVQKAPVVVMTAKTSAGARKMGEKVGVGAYLTKPFTREGLVSLIERQVAQNRSMRALEWDLVLASITALAKALDERDPYTRFHSENVSRYAVAIGRKAGMNAVQLENLRIAGLLHDMGKIGIPDNLLHKPGRLTDEEFELVKNHSQLGAEILKPIPSLEDVIPGILHHHERIDGGGYPFGLKEEQIPPTAQILAVADTYDALVTDRPYRRGMPKEQALTIMKEVAGAQLSNYYVRLFMEWLGE
jgi:response regulator RpfG family c-di-GMP phosphodiesterase